LGGGAAAHSSAVVRCNMFLTATFVNMVPAELYLPRRLSKGMWSWRMFVAGGICAAQI